MKKIIVTLLAFFSPISAYAGSYAEHPQAKAFIDMMVKNHGFEASYVIRILNDAERKQAIIDAISRPAEKTKPWHEYRDIFMQPTRVEGGVNFWRENQVTIDTVAKEYGVAPQIIVAIIGVETRYGTYMGSYRVIDALTTLGFDYPKRGEFFTKQLEEFLLLTREQQQNPLDLKGSYAGAMGYGQFIPSSYRSFAVDEDKDGFADIWVNKKDAIASIANYFKAHGWQTNEPVVERASRSPKFPDKLINSGDRPKTSAIELSKLGFSALNRKTTPNKPAVALRFDGVDGDEFWLGYNNFYVITRYNRSPMYALAVFQLSEEIAASYASATKPL